MRPKKLIYTFVSYASHRNTSWGHGTPEEGVERVAAVAHKHNIPVTWIVNSRSIAFLAGKIRDWHRLYGDDVILQSPLYERNLVNKKDEFIQTFEDEWNILKTAFPWAETKVAAQGVITNQLIEYLEEVDCKGLWGYCWEQSWWDGITHKGIPWGQWFIDKNRYKAPNGNSGGVVACEWTARDLNLAYHTHSPCIYSSDPDDVYRAGLCTGDNIDYWKKLFDEYLSNTDNNENVYFLHHQEAHEMEVTDRFAVWPMSQIEEDEKMLDNFFNYIKQYDITITTLPKSIKQYHESNSYTAPCYMLTKDCPIRPAINDYNMTLGGIGLGPYPDTFLYYDKECQMAFVNGECKPELFRNYTGKTDMDDGFLDKVPPLFVSNFMKSENEISMEFKIECTESIPFGLTYWDDLKGFEVKSCEGANEVKIIQDRLVFIRFNLNGAKKIIQLVLNKKM